MRVFLERISVTKQPDMSQNESDSFAGVDHAGILCIGDSSGLSDAGKIGTLFGTGHRAS